MRPTFAITLLCSCSILFCQTPATTQVSTSGLQVSVPRLIRLSGSLNTDGQSRTMGVTFAIYAEEKDGPALWQEVQNVTVDVGGRYSVLLGSSMNEGLPLDLFASGEARWLGVRADQEPEQPRTLLVAVPYALKAVDAETLGGKPASSFVTTEQLSSGPAISPNRVQTSLVSGGTPLAANVTGSGSQNVLPKFDASGTNLVNSLLFDDGTHVGVGTQSPTFQFDEQNTDTSAAGSNMFRIQTPSVNGATMHFISTSANGRHFGFGSNFILGTGEFGIYDYTANANRFLIAGNGNIGIGTSTPQFNFDLQNSDSTAAGANIFRLRTPSVNGAVMHFQSTSANGHDWAFGSNFILGAGEFGVYDYTANASRLFITGAGNIGIGTSSPASLLEVAGNLSVSGSGVISGNGAGLVNVLPAAGSSNYIQNSSSPQSANFNITGNGAIAGSVGIGTSSLGQKLSVAGTVESTSGGFKFPDGTVQTTAAGSSSLAANVILTSNTSVPSGSCISQGIAVSGATTAMAVIISPSGDPSAKGLNDLLWGAFVDSSNHVTAQFCHFGRSSATASANQTFNVRVIN
jgi:hypothetical protein